MAFNPVFGVSCDAAHSRPTEHATCINCSKTSVIGGWYASMESITPYNLVCAMILHLCKALHIWPTLFLDYFGQTGNRSDAFVCSKRCAWEYLDKHVERCITPRE